MKNNKKHLLNGAVGAYAVKMAKTCGGGGVNPLKTLILGFFLMGNIAYGQLWIGEGDGFSWGDQNNWDPNTSVPDINDDVIIGNPTLPGNNLIISNTEQCKSITFIENGIINFATTSGTHKLEVFGDFINNSNNEAIVGNSNGTVVIKGNASSVIGGTTAIELFNLEVRKVSVAHVVDITTPSLDIWLRLYVHYGVLYSNDNLRMMANLTNATTANVEPNTNGLGEILGIVTVQQRVQNGMVACYHYLGSPVGNEDYSGFYTIGNQFPDNTDQMTVSNYNFSLTSSSLPEWFTYNETDCADSGIDVAYIQNYYSTSYSVTLTTAQANWVLTSFGWESNSNLLTDQIPVGKGVMSLGRMGITENIVDWNGYLNNGDIHVTLLKTTCDNADGLNLVANPYPSPIDWNVVYGHNVAEIGPFAYIWTPDLSAANPIPGAAFASGYFTVLDANANTSAISSPIWADESGLGSNDQFIGIGQGFFVVADDANSGLEFQNSDRVANNVENILRESKPMESLQLTLQNANGRDYTNIYLSAAANNAYNSKEDAIKLMNSSVNLSSMLNGKAMMVNRLSNQYDEIAVPLNVSVKAGETSTIAIGSTAFESNEFVAIFTDKKLKNQQVITSNFKYSFTSQVGDENDRFEIKFVKGNYTLNNEVSNTASMYVNNKQLNVFSNSINDGNVTITDASGRILQQEQVNFSNGKGLVNLNELSTGIYIITVQDELNSFTQKLMINK